MVAVAGLAHDLDRPVSPFGVSHMSTFIPATILVLLGASLTVLGVLAGGSLALIVIGLAGVFGAGLLNLASAKRS
jgi:hypothetical protein